MDGWTRQQLTWCSVVEAGLRYLVWKRGGRHHGAVDREERKKTSWGWLVREEEHHCVVGQGQDIVHGGTMKRLAKIKRTKTLLTVRSNTTLTKRGWRGGGIVLGF